MKTVQNISYEICTGCGACRNCCPYDALEMKTDDEGFLVPVINSEKCCKCGLCADICPVLNHKQVNIIKKPFCYAAWSEDEKIRLTSTSGGVFTHLAETVLRHNGTVIGAAYKSDNLVAHTIIHAEDQIASLRQSKYVQSEIGLIFRKVKDELKYEKPLLFVGTPCQCAGLQAYLGKFYENLILCDFICRGVNSPLAYLSYLEELEKQYGSKVKNVWFKNKTFGWNKFATKITFKNGKEYIADRETDPFMLGYIKSNLTLYMRQSCYQCMFKGISRGVDITLGDFWGIEKILPDIDTTKGVSIVLTHSQKGENLLAECQNISIKKIEDDSFTVSNPCISQSVEFKSNRKPFFDKLKTESFSECIDFFKNKI